MPTALDFKLSPHFTWGEMTRTGQAGLQEKNRQEAEQYLEKAKVLCSTIMEPIREKWGPIKVTSCFRGPAVNAAVGSKPTSQHCLFEAVDFDPTVKGVTHQQVFDWIRHESKIPFGQLIYEHPGKSLWIHISLGEPYRPKDKCRQVFDFDGKTYTPVK